MSRAIKQRDRKARIRAHARAGAWHMALWPRDTVTWWKSRRHYVRGAGAIFLCNRKSARVKISIATEAPRPKSLEVEPGSQDDVL